MQLDTTLVDCMRELKGDEWLKHVLVFSINRIVLVAQENEIRFENLSNDENVLIEHLFRLIRLREM